MEWPRILFEARVPGNSGLHREAVMTSLYEEWQNLCDEHDAARDAYSDAFKVVNSKFSSVAKGASKINSTEKELEKSELRGTRGKM
jgi:hypothetical protein